MPSYRSISITNVHSLAVLFDRKLICKNITVVRHRVHTTVVLELRSHLVVIFRMLITKHAYMLELILVEPMGRLCLGRFVAQLSST